MSKFSEWKLLEKGVKCPFDLPRPESNEHWDKVATLSCATLYLHKIQTYRGYCVLVFDRRHVTALHELDDEERPAIMSDLCRAQEVLRATVKPDHFNVESLGNAIPHLHWHLIPRYRNDPRWGLPIWMTEEAELPRISLAETDRAALLRQLKEALAV